MADLSAMYMDLAENTRNAPYQGMQRAQQFMENQLAYQKAREDLEAQRGLRALFAEKPNATSEEVSRYSPQLGMEMNKYAQEAQERTGRMTKTQREISDMEAKAVAETLGPIAERAMLTGDINAYHREIGQAASALQQQGIQLPMNFDPGQHTPDIVLRNSVGRGYKSPLMENQMATQREQMLSQVPPRMSPEQAYGGVDMGTYGPRFKPPIPQGGRMPRGTGMAGAPAAQIPNNFQRATVEDLPTLEQEYNNATDVNEKQMIGALINQLRQKTQAPAQGGGFVTPEQEAELRLKEKQQEAEISTKAATEKKTGELTAQQKFSNKQAIDAYLRLRPPHEITKLIRESIQGGGADKINQLANLMGVSLPEATPSAALEVIAQQMVASKPFPPGSQSEKELEARMKSIGDPASKVPADQRLAQFEEFMREQEGLIGQQAEFSDEQLIDLVNKGYIKKETAAEVYKRMHRGK